MIPLCARLHFSMLSHSTPITFSREELFNIRKYTPDFHQFSQTWKTFWGGKASVWEAAALCRIWKRHRWGKHANAQNMWNSNSRDFKLHSHRFTCCIFAPCSTEWLSSLPQKGQTRTFHVLLPCVSLKPGSVSPSLTVDYICKVSIKVSSYISSCDDMC